MKVIIDKGKISTIIGRGHSDKICCGTCALFYANSHCHKATKNPIIRRTGDSACAAYISREVCNNGDCERHKLGAEPCTGCRFCDEEGSI